MNIHRTTRRLPRRAQPFVKAMSGAFLAFGATLAQAAPVIESSFEGISQYDAASFGRGFRPPDTMGAVGTTQFLESSNGAFAVYDKASGNQLSLVSDLAFWGAAGQTGANGDNRVLFDHFSQRWIVAGFGNNFADVQIAVSDTADALGPWKSVKFTGYAGGTADYPTLALDKNGVYIGTNNFNAADIFQGVSLFSIPRADLFSAVPSLANMTSFDALSFRDGGGNFQDPNRRGFTLQGAVNFDPGQAANAPGKIVAVDNFAFAFDRFNVNNPGGAGATLSPTPSALVNVPGYVSSFNNGRQPGLPASIDTLDDRISANVVQHGNYLYWVHTIGDGTNHTALRWYVMDATTNAIVQTGDIGGGGYDYYQGSIAVDQFGHAVIGYNRSGSNPADGKVRFYARAFDPIGGGMIASIADYFIKESLVDDYDCGFHGTPGLRNGVACRQRWGDYSAVTIDPLDPNSFWLIGEFAREWDDASGGHPGGSNLARWGTWIAELDFGEIPEPSSSALVALGLLGIATRRRLGQGRVAPGSIPVREA